MRLRQLTTTCSCLFFLAPAAAQRLSVEPAEPMAGARFDVRYDRDADVFAADDTIHAAATFMTRGGVQHRSVRLEEGRGELRVPADAHYLYLQVTSRSRHDAAAELETMVVGTDGEPARGARLRAMFRSPARIDELVAAELAAYPDNFIAYRMKWMLSAGPRVDAETRRKIEADLARIGAAETDAGLRARSYGLMMLGREPEARALLLRALREHPTSGETAQLIGEYGYQCYAQGVPVDAAVKREQRALIEAHPTTFHARDQVRTVSYSDAFSLAATTAVCEAWMRDEPLHPEPRYVLARALWKKGGDLDAAASLAREAANGYLRGDLRLCGDATGSMTAMMLPAALRSAAEIALARGDHAGALAYARLGQELDPRTHAGVVECEARAWRALGRHDRAARTWVAALGAGSKVARRQLQELHAGAGVDLELDAWIDSLTDRDAAARPRAAAFSIADLDGETVELSALRGRVVVLNFWGLGCAPCKVEIPHLSALAESFVDDEVEFIAFGTDAPDAIRAYLAEHPFAYRQVAGAGRVALDYAVSAWPTHVFIDKQGRVAATFVGGSDDVAERFRPVVERLLRER